MSDATKPSRRDFLKKSTAVATGAALAGGLNFSRMAHAAGSDILKDCLDRLWQPRHGRMANCLEHCKNVKLYAVADLFEEKARMCLECSRRM